MSLMEILVPFVHLSQCQKMLEKFSETLFKVYPHQLIHEKELFLGISLPNLSLQPIIRYGHSLTSLDLRRTSSTTTAECLQVIEKCVNLRTLVISYTNDKCLDQL